LYSDDAKFPEAVAAKNDDDDTAKKNDDDDDDDQANSSNTQPHCSAEQMISHKRKKRAPLRLYGARRR
jgi:hypothetical protein